MTLLAVLVCGVDGGGEPKGGTSNEVSTKLSLVGPEASKTLFDVTDASKGVPRFQARKRGCRGRLQILLLPPIIFEIVAVISWLGPGCVQVALV